MSAPSTRTSHQGMPFRHGSAASICLDIVTSMVRAGQTSATEAQTDASRPLVIREHRRLLGCSLPYAPPPDCDRSAERCNPPVANDGETARVPTILDQTPENGRVWLVLYIGLNRLARSSHGAVQRVDDLR